MADLQELIDISKGYDAHKQDYVVNSADVLFDEHTAELIVPGNLFGAVPPLTMTDWALRQVCQKVGHIPASYAKDCPAWLQAINLNHWMHNVSKDLMIRGYDQHCRGVLSAQYAPIMNTVVLEKTAQIMEDVGFYETHYLDADTFHGKFTVANKPGGDNKGGFGVGFYLGNGEIGNRAIRVCPYIQKNKCQNSIVFQDWGIEIRHYRTTPAYIFGAIKETIGKSIGLAAEAVDRFVEAEMAEIPDVTTVLDGLADKYNLSLPVKDAMLFGTEGKSTLAGIINGISYAAQQIENIEQRIDMESLAGAILADPSALKRKVKLQEMDDFLEMDVEGTLPAGRL